MTPEQAMQIADAINGVKFALFILAGAVLLGGPSMSDVRRGLDGIAKALRERKQ